jgi:hypothetical protein
LGQPLYAQPGPKTFIFLPEPFILLPNLLAFLHKMFTLGFTYGYAVGLTYGYTVGLTYGYTVGAAFVVAFGEGLFAYVALYRVPVTPLLDPLIKKRPYIVHKVYTL